MEEGTSRQPTGQRGGRRGRGKIVPIVSVEEQILQVAVPTDARFKGYEDFVVQDLVLRARVIRYRRERWVTPDGRTGRSSTSTVLSNRTIERLSVKCDR
jgi:hypothetical protein